MCSMKIKTLVFASAFLFMTTSQNGVYAENRSDDNAGIHKEAEVLRNKEGDIIGIDVTDEPDMTDYDTVDFDMLIEHPLWKEYEKFDLAYDKEKKQIFFAGMLVDSIADQYSDETILYYDRDEFFRNMLNDKNSEDLESLEESDESETVAEDNEEMQEVALVAQRDQEYKLQYFTFIRNN